MILRFFAPNGRYGVVVKRKRVAGINAYAVETLTLCLGDLNLSFPRQNPLTKQAFKCAG